LEIKREALDDFAEEGPVDPRDPKRRPLLHRMAADKKQHLEKGSVGGSEYFTVQLPDGALERRQKAQLNVDPGVHSSFQLDQFQFMAPHTPVLLPGSPNHVPLSTIAEMEKGREGSIPAGVFQPTSLRREKGQGMEGEKEIKQGILM